jgi:hypothetical protein
MRKKATDTVESEACDVKFLAQHQGSTGQLLDRLNNSIMSALKSFVASDMKHFVFGRRVRAGAIEGS